MTYASHEAPRALPSEGRGQGFESLRVRHPFRQYFSELRLRLRTQTGANERTTSASSSTPAARRLPECSW